MRCIGLRPVRLSSTPTSDFGFRLGHRPATVHTPNAIPSDRNVRVFQYMTRDRLLLLVLITTADFHGKAQKLSSVILHCKHSH
jgi:hypothetical protein